MLSIVSESVNSLETIVFNSRSNKAKRYFHSSFCLTHKTVKQVISGKSPIFMFNFMIRFKNDVFYTLMRDFNVMLFFLMIYESYGDFH